MRERILSVFLLLSIFVLGVVLYRSGGPGAAHKETAYERVSRTMTLRCGYMIAPPFVDVDPNTSKPSGMNIDYTTAMAGLLGLKVEWDEVLLGQQAEAMRAGKVDAICAGEGPLVASASLFLRYSTPIAYFPLGMFVRADDERFDGTHHDVLEKANNAAFSVVFMDGDTSQDSALLLFPRTQKHELPQTADFAQIYMDVAAGKADFVIEDPFSAAYFMQNNPGKLRQVKLDKPFAMVPNQMSVLYGQEALAALLDQGIQLMRQRGVEDRVLAPYEREYPNAFYRVSLPYKAP